MNFFKLVVLALCGYIVADAILFMFGVELVKTFGFAKATLVSAVFMFLGVVVYSAAAKKTPPADSTNEEHPT